MPALPSIFRRIADLHLGRRTPPAAADGAATVAPPPEPDTPQVAQIRKALQGVLDPELGLDIVSLGLVHSIEVHDGCAKVELLVTTPACPLGEQIQREAEASIRRDIKIFHDIHVSLRRDLPWRPERMDAAARQHMGW